MDQSSSAYFLLGIQDRLQGVHDPGLRRNHSTESGYLRPLHIGWQSRRKNPRTPPAGGPRVCQGPHVTLSMIFFLDFLMFSKYL